ncbi:hypothetical protein M2651_08345 [Clostridium sp. SYSU_GA19001]|uniref:CD1247 N-terminal domain-containing protein n=1 Tax=Clostridium caldaquaticum TaxID=2940653 RepID=UPI0020777F4C|nr:CD1247 N-terminal domain-containing protein [Clostridium caldaquaticum]MCM8711035.1 hypothetical protein [Clostridium caldaquaticum]
MESMVSKVAYLNGLIDGMDIDKTTKEGRAISEIASILKTMAEEIDLLRENQNEMEDYVDAIDEDLSNLEEDIYDDEECEEDDLGSYINLQCPHCEETVYIDRDICRCNEKITCPNCHKEVLLDCCKEKEK